MKKLPRLLLVSLLGLSVTTPLVNPLTAAPEFELPSGPAFTADPYENETEAERDARMAWWREARFGMFIHWGLYAVPAGIYKGEQIPSIGEWIMLKAEIPVEEYKGYAEVFNPTAYDPEFWAELASDAGMRYMIITSKHHDGFSLFPSAVTDWDIESTPYGEDLIGPLAEAARAEGLKFGLYYSQCQDWIHPGGSKSGYRWRAAELGQEPYWDNAHKGNYNDYLRDIAIPQVGEILSRYQPDVLWWDTPRGTQPEHAAKLAALLRIKPGIIHNNRLGGGFEGDTETPEQHIPATGVDDRDWEVCMTMNNTWGYKSWDHDWKSTEDLIQKLCDIVSKGGNFLLNVGPKADGSIPQPSIDRLKAVGAWMDVNSESIYGTSANPFHRLTWGRATQKAHGDRSHLYLQVFDWPQDGVLRVPGLRSPVTAAHLLEGEQSLLAEQQGGSVVIRVPREAPDPYVSVIRLEIDGPLEIVPIMPEQAADGSIELTPAFVDLHNRGYGEKMFLERNGSQTTIRRWTDDRAWIGWSFRVDQPGTFDVFAEVATLNSVEYTIGLADGVAIKDSLEGDGELTLLNRRKLGQITIPEAGMHQLEWRPIRNEWNEASVGRLQLVPVN